MAVDPCSLEALTAEGCYECLNRKQKLAVEIYFKTNTLALNDGTDYTADFPQLLEDSACLKCLPGPRLDSAKLVIAQDEADNAGLRSLTIDDALAATKCLLCTDEKAMEVALVLLECKIQAAAGAPV